MQTLESRAVQRKQSLDVISVRRNPYLVDYEEQKRLRRAVNEPFRVSGETVRGRSRRPSEDMKRRSLKTIELARERNCGRTPGSGRRNQSLPSASEERSRAGMRGERSRSPSRSAGRRSQRTIDVIDMRGGRCRAVPADRRQSPAAAKKALQKRRKKQLRQRRLMAAAWVLCMFMIGWLVMVKKGEASEQSDSVQEFLTVQEDVNTSHTVVQGLPGEVFAKHPVWTENFLPLNEYSRPGETLPEVRDIFVHYTANPGTSAAQNRSYFEQQKDMHEASVSAHFIIGYEGEIIQCVPLDEIAYAVQTRNYDSVSIECCYKAADGSFTQETYDSLVVLLAWLTDAYGLDAGHILRHYDCGGKKCPLYYTEHEDAWMRLKSDVSERQGGV